MHLVKVIWLSLILVLLTAYICAVSHAHHCIPSFAPPAKPKNIGHHTYDGLLLPGREAKWPISKIVCWFVYIS